MKKSFTFWDILPALLIIAGVLWLIGRFGIKRKQTDQPETIDAEAEVIPDDDKETEVTREKRIVNHYTLIREALPRTVPDHTAKLITAQAMHETGVFTSRLYKEQNNLFGMRQPTVRETRSTGGRDGWANFATLEDSVQDLLLYFKEFGLKPTWKEPNVFVKEIREKGYFTDPYIDYFNAVRSHLATVKTLVQ